MRCNDPHDVPHHLEGCITGGEAIRANFKPLLVTRRGGTYAQRPVAPPCLANATHPTSFVCVAQPKCGPRHRLYQAVLAG